MRHVLKVIGLILVPVAIIFSIWVLNRSYPLKSGEVHMTEVSIGETVSFEITENASTGFGNCWINESDCRLVRLIRRVTKEDLIDNLTGMIGSGYVVEYTFEGVSTGTDTVLIKMCPTGRMQQECSYFSLDSLPANADSILAEGYTPYGEPNYVVVVNVVN